MKVLHAYPHMLAPGGRPADSRALISALARLEHDTGVLYLDSSTDEEEIIPDPSVNLYPLPGGPASLPKLHRVVETFAPDIVHFTGGPRHPIQNLWACYLQARDIPYTLSGCGNLSFATFVHRWGGKPNRWYHTTAKFLFYLAFDRPLMKQASAIHAAAPHEAGIARDIADIRVFTIPFGIPKEWLTERSTVNRRQLNNPVTFVYLGRLSPIHKGLDLVLEAFGKLSQPGSDNAYRLILAGTSEGNSLDRLQQKARDLDITVSFPGGIWGSDKQNFWSEADFYLHMARYNGFARAPREALAQGLPLITTRESDLGDWVDQHDMGRMVPLDTDVLAEQLNQLINLHPDRYRAMTQNAWKFARETSWTAVARQLTQEYEEILS